MGYIDSGGSDLDVDLESGGTTSDEDGTKEQGSRGEQVKKLLGEAWGGLEGLDGMRGVDGLSSYKKLLNSGEVSVANMQILSDKLGQETACFVEKKLKEKRNKQSLRNGHNYSFLLRDYLSRSSRFSCMTLINVFFHQIAVCREGIPLPKSAYELQDEGNYGDVLDVVNHMLERL
ncbi:hypothetical protein F0562_029206 [Nyssa sinensis]|uniref:Uncharacterized protein n=1 Tax=Nyssa sinensis TaxID=561372 RepID=A0A5J5B291_9ASTE|nr:hypothetical protein F0562_029206 [Nyssa sinensis]